LGLILDKSSIKSEFLGGNRVLAKKSAENVRNYQPFRYPGGKTKLAKNPAFRVLLDSMLTGAETFYEGFLGSAAITLDLALRYPRMKFVGCDRDRTISGFWQLIARGTDAEFQELLALIQKPTVELFQQLRSRAQETEPLSLVERAHHALFFNRTCFSGIAMSQPIGGFNQISQWTIDCRYNVPLLQQKIQNLRVLFAGRLTVMHADCVDWLGQIPAGVPLFLDPPYYVKGDVLYPEKMDAFQHGKLAEVLAARTNWIMSYDICDEIKTLYGFAQLLEVGFRYSINGKKKDWKAANEYIIASPELDVSSFETRTDLAVVEQ
jgi:DNA adenine methylase